MAWNRGSHLRALGGVEALAGGSGGRAPEGPEPLSFLHFNPDKQAYFGPLESDLLLCLDQFYLSYTEIKANLGNFGFIIFMEKF